ncbi:glycosyltransferase WbsX family protein [Hungatella hathewayi]
MKKIIAFYLPQFHTIPENDLWWGKGFTEWTNTKKARPLYDGHYQPKIPLNKKYYDLSDVNVMVGQAQLAKKYGVYGFCYYHYWFKQGKKLLEKPVENMLREPAVDIPFCLCWANENWCKNWDGGNKEIIMEQDYGSKKDWEKHYRYLSQFFHDERYIKYNGKPVLIIYKPEEIIKFNQMIDYWNELSIKEGFLGLIILRQFPTSMFYDNFDDSHIDYSIKFEPIMSQSWEYFNQNPRIDYRTYVTNLKWKATLLYKILRRIKQILKQNKTVVSQLRIEDYDKAWNIILHDEPYGDKIINGAFVDWDNTARNVNGCIYKGATPEKFGQYLKELIQKESAMDFIFINAWNEWAEGAYLEPDEKHGYEYLDELARVIRIMNQ